jgi:hypothetical protein
MRREHLSDINPGQDAPPAPALCPLACDAKCREHTFEPRLLGAVRSLYERTDLDRGTKNGEMGGKSASGGPMETTPSIGRDAAINERLR